MGTALTFGGCVLMVIAVLGYWVGGNNYTVHTSMLITLGFGALFVVGLLVAIAGWSRP